MLRNRITLELDTYIHKSVSIFDLAAEILNTRFHCLHVGFYVILRAMRGNRFSTKFT